MPELPEVETTRRGIAPHLVGRDVAAVVVRQWQLRWPVPADLQDQLVGNRIHRVERRAKYLLIAVGEGHMIVHLGMTGSLRMVAREEPPGKHDHLDVTLVDGGVLRMRDPRRFGAVLWSADRVACHPLLADLGPEPLHDEFNAHHLYRLSRGRRSAVKAFIMDGKVVVGVGNIYANEALFMAGIDPRRASGRISLLRYQRLVTAIKAVLARSIRRGGTTLRDFVGGNGEPGYFKQSLLVYGRKGECCRGCSAPLQEVRLAQRSTVYCPRCQR